MSKINLVTLLALTFVISSCSKIANLSSVYRPFNISTGNGALIDIKQRAILVGEVYAKDIKHTDGTLVKKKVACAEPSPDSLSSYLSTVSGDLDITDKGKASFNKSLTESAAFVGLRTQSIQLLRDSYYRLCEAYMNGAISSNDYDIILRRYQKNTIALLAIESLTGTVKVPQSTALQSNLSSQLIALNTKEKSLNSQITALGEDKDKEKPALQAELKAVKQNYSSILSILKNTSAQNATATSGTQSGNIALTVASLTKEVLSTDYYGQLCWALFAKNLSVDKTVKEACKHFFTLKNMDLKQITKSRQQNHNIKLRVLNDLEKQRQHQLRKIDLLKDKLSKEVALKIINDKPNSAEQILAGINVNPNPDIPSTSLGIFNVPALLDTSKGFIIQNESMSVDK